MFARLLIVAGLVVPVGLVVGAWPATGSQARQSATPLYTITDLGILPETGAEGVLVDDLNELGHVVGRVYGELPPQEWNRGYIYADAMSEPWADQGGLWEAQGVNDVDHVTGGANFTVGSYRSDAAFWDGRVLHNITDVEGVSGGYGYAINNSDHIAGYIVVTATTHAFFYNGALYDIGTTLPANTDSRGIGINDHDQIVGNYYDNDTPTTHPFLYSDGHLTNIGALPGDATAQAVAINNLGQVLGMSGSAESPFLYDHGSIYPVFGLGGSSVAGLNDEDEIVGYGSQGGFVYANGNTTVLSTTILLDSGWSYLNPLAINNSGQITGTGLHNGQSRVFLLTPLFPHPTPTSPPVPTPTGTPTVTATPLPAPTTATRAVTLTFSTGWSLVALPLVPDSPLSAYGLLTSVLQSSGGSFAELASWNGVGWVTAIDSGGSLQGSDLPITQTQGYFLYTDAPATYVLQGKSAGS